MQRAARETPPVRILFLESMADDEELLEHNYRMKLINDDYKGVLTARTADSRPC